MEQSDSSSVGSVPPPKRFGKRILQSRPKKALYILLPLILINAGIAHTLINQIAIKANAKATTQVKDDSVTLATEGSVVDENTTESSLDNTDPQAVITTYIVKNGDTLSGIANQFNISINTIRWANDLTLKSTIKPGDELVILPVSGIEYTVKKGDTLSGIAVKFDSNQDEIINYNDIQADAIKVGMELIIPGAEPLVVAPKATPKPIVKKVPSKVATNSVKTPTIEHVSSSEDTKDIEDEKNVSTKEVRFSNPIPGGHFTQGIHDGNAVDFGAPVGTEVEAAAAGTVIIAKGSGYNGGYGNYIVITHSDGSQTLYAHLSKVSVASGDSVAQGQMIGLSGNSGKSTGPHLHYKEMNTGSRNTFSSYKKGTQM
jgi:murein DD-endopeptidase MepM/ murein hydrolase activator NlpD